MRSGSRLGCIVLALSFIAGVAELSASPFLGPPPEGSYQQQVTPSSPGRELPILPDNYIDPAPRVSQPWLMGGAKKGVDWKGLAWQSGLFLGAQHAFRLA